jgi:predicted acylesterase/phospholipase RssA
MPDSNGHKHAVILSGGGAYGAYEVGTMKALFNGQSPATRSVPLDAQIFTGTSAGALNAAFMTMRPGEASSLTVRDLEKVWIDDLSDSPAKCGNGVYRLRGDPLRALELDCLTNHPTDPVVTATEDAAFFAKYFFVRGMNFLRSRARTALV